MGGSRANLILFLKYDITRYLGSRSKSKGEDKGQCRGQNNAHTLCQIVLVREYSVLCRKKRNEMKPFFFDTPIYELQIHLPSHIALHGTRSSQRKFPRGVTGHAFVVIYCLVCVCACVSVPVMVWTCQQPHLLRGFWGGRVFEITYVLALHIITLSHMWLI